MDKCLYFSLLDLKKKHFLINISDTPMHKHCKTIYYYGLFLSNKDYFASSRNCWQFLDTDILHKCVPDRPKRKINNVLINSNKIDKTVVRGVTGHITDNYFGFSLSIHL